MLLPFHIGYLRPESRAHDQETEHLFPQLLDCRFYRQNLLYNKRLSRSPFTPEEASHVKQVALCSRKSIANISFEIACQPRRECERVRV